MVTQKATTSQYFLGLNETEKLSAYENLLSKISSLETNHTIEICEKIKIIADKDREIAHLKEVNEISKSIINNNRNHIEEMSQWMQWHIKLLSNPLVSSSEKERMAAYHDYMELQPIREDSSRYYNAHDIAAKLGYVKVQQVYKIHSLMQQAGLITSISKPQEGDKTKQNTYDFISMDFWLHPDKIQLKDHSEWGGMHAIHKGCGGECKGRFVYLCTKCGEDYIERKDVTLMSDEKYEDYLSLMAQAESMPIEALDKIADKYEVTSHISELEYETDKEKAEIFHKSINQVMDRKRVQGYFSLSAGTPIYKKEISIEHSNGPP